MLLPLPLQLPSRHPHHDLLHPLRSPRYFPRHTGFFQLYSSLLFALSVQWQNILTGSGYFLSLAALLFLQRWKTQCQELASQRRWVWMLLMLASVIARIATTILATASRWLSLLLCTAFLATFCGYTLTYLPRTREWLANAFLKWLGCCCFCFKD